MTQEDFPWIAVSIQWYRENIKELTRLHACPTSEKWLLSFPVQNAKIILMFVEYEDVGHGQGLAFKNSYGEEPLADQKTIDHYLRVARGFRLEEGRLV